MATKFIQNIVNSKATLANRAALIEKQAAAAQNNIISHLEIEKMNAESQIQAMLDFAPDSAHSLKPNAANFNATEWVKDLQALKMKIRRIDEALEVATATYEELFMEKQ